MCKANSTDVHAVLEEIEEHPAAEEFVDPVEKERATDYYDIIANPMCLSSMKLKVYDGHYSTPKMVKTTVPWSLL